MAKECIDRDLDWIDEKFVKSICRVHYLVLISHGCDHGYEIMQHLKGHYHMKASAAAVYPVLQSLEEDGYIRGEWMDGTYPQRKRYTLTPSGKRLLKAASARITSLLRKIVRQSG